MSQDLRELVLARQSAGHCIACGHRDGDALVLLAQGGYDLFVDPMGSGPAAKPFRLCGTCLVAAPSWLRSAWPWVPEGAYLPVGSCLACDRPLDLIISEIAATGARLFSADNTLHLDRRLGRLGADDHIEVSPTRSEATICHDCGHELCEQVPAIGVVLDPARSHAHRDEYWQAHPDHIGWDDPKRER